MQMQKKASTQSPPKKYPRLMLYIGGAILLCLALSLPFLLNMDWGGAEEPLPTSVGPSNEDTSNQPFSTLANPSVLIELTGTAETEAIYQQTRAAIHTQQANSAVNAATLTRQNALDATETAARLTQ